VTLNSGPRGVIVGIGRDVSLLANQLLVEGFLPCTGAFGC
jgi:hypothetical protein